MFVSPVKYDISPDNSKESGIRKAWANYIIFENNKFYSIFGTGLKSEENPSGYANALDIAVSDDGVHWTFISRNAIPIKGAHAGYGIKKIGEYFYYYPTCSNSEKGVHFKVLRTKDFIDFEHLGDEYDVVPDRNYYHERWDEVHVIEDKDEFGRDVYYGYISSETRDDVGEPGCGFIKSYDGIKWEVLPPIEIVWGEIPSHHMELNFVEKIGDFYFLSMSGRLYFDSYGYSLFNFRSSSPRGPFYPDTEKFRLSGNSRREVTWLGHSIAYGNEFLAALWLSHNILPDIPSDTFAIGDLKKILYERGHIRLAYWWGTEAAKGDSINIDYNNIKLIYPDKKIMNLRDNLEINGDTIKISASRNGVIALFDETFDKTKGFFIEGQLCVKESRTHIATHHHSAEFGFYFDCGDNSGTAIIAQTLGVTKCGNLRFDDHRITDNNPYLLAGRGLADSRSGILEGTFEFAYDDVVGPSGVSSYCGIRHGKIHDFKLLARSDYFVLYIDDYYVQTYLMPENFNGKVGLCCFDGTAEIKIIAFDMNF